MGGGGTTLSQKVRVPLHSNVPAKITLWKRCPFPTFFFFIFRLRNSHSLNWWNQNYLGAPTTRSEGKKIYICKIGWAAQIGGYITHTHTPKTKTKNKNKQNKTKQKTKQNKTKQNKNKNKQTNKQTKNCRGAPSLNCSSYDYPFKKVPLSNTFFIVWLQNSHNDYDAFQKLMKSELFGCPFNKGRGGHFLYVRNTGMCRPIWWICTKSL